LIDEELIPSRVGVITLKIVGSSIILNVKWLVVLHILNSLQVYNTNSGWY
jgi:hypothetical protein